MKESKIESNLRKRVFELGGLCLKFVSPGFTGVPDRIVNLPGGIIFYVETKAYGKNLRPRQAYVKRQFEALGISVFKIDYLITHEQLKDLIHEI